MSAFTSQPSRAHKKSSQSPMQDLPNPTTKPQICHSATASDINTEAHSSSVRKYYSKCRLWHDTYRPSGISSRRASGPSPIKRWQMESVCEQAWSPVAGGQGDRKLQVDGADDTMECGEKECGDVEELVQDLKRLKLSRIGE